MGDLVSPIKYLAKNYSSISSAYALLGAVVVIWSFDYIRKQALIIILLIV